MDIFNGTLMNKNNKLRNSMEYRPYSKDIIKEENEDGNVINESQEDNNEEDSEIQNVSNFQYYFEVIITVIMSLNSFFIYSYLSIIHIAFCFLLLFSRFIIEYNFWAKSKKPFMIILLVIDIIYFLAKSIFFIIYALTDELSEKFEFLYPYFIVEYDWKNYYDYGIVAFIIILILVYLITGEFDEEIWVGSIIVKTTNFLHKESLMNNNILNTGLFFIALGAAVYPCIINLFILVVICLFFGSYIVNKKLQEAIKNFIALLMMIIIPIYTISNYILNSKEISCIVNNKFNNFIFVNLFNNNEDDDNAQNEYLIGNVVYTGCFPFLFFILGFDKINLHFKCEKLNELKENEVKKILRKSKKKHSFLSNLSLDSNNSMINIIKKDRIFSLSESINSDKKRKQLQTIFNANIDCGIIIFIKESSEVNFFTKIKMFILKFCYTPAFSLHICRISVILWINCYITYASIIFIIWLFLSINFSNEEFFFIITKIIVFPLLVIIFIISYFSNIKGVSLDSQFFGFIYYPSGKDRFFHMANKFLIISFFQIYIHLKTKHAILLKNNEIREEIKIQQKELENVIEHDFKGKYVTKPLEIFFKSYFILLDIIVVISFYLSITQTINILNQLGLLFLISLFLLNNKFFKFYGTYFCLIMLNI